MRLQVIRFILTLFVMGSALSPVQANDSDVVNCNRSFKIVVLGSSTAYGVGASNADSSWVGKFTAYLKRKNTANQVINLAIPGFTTYNNLCPLGFVPPAGRPSPVFGYSITDALAEQPDAIIINMPSNDAANDYTLTEQQDNFERTMHLADSANIPVWVTTTQPRNNLNATQMANLQAMRLWILSRFGNKAIEFYDGLANPDGSIILAFDFDDVHLNDLGHQELYARAKAETILDSLCNRYVQEELVARAGPDQFITLPLNSVTLDGSQSSALNGTITDYAWTKISGPSSFNITSPGSAITTVTNLVEGRYSFVLTVTKDNSLTRSDTVRVVVSSRVLIDFGPDISGNPDAGGKYWNNIANGQVGVKLSNAITVGNAVSSIGLEIINRIDGTFNIAGAGTNTGNTTGDVGDYPSTATADFAFAHPSATNGQWKITGLDPLKQYHIKFWGSRTGVPDARIIEIKQAEQSVWQQYDATDNTSFTNAALFTVVNKTEAIFDIRVKDGSAFGYIDLIDIDYSVYDPGTNIPPVARAGNDKSVTLPASSVTLDGSASEDYNGSIVNYEWTKLTGPVSFNIATPNNAVTLVNNLVLGVYTFELKVTDDEGAISRDTIRVTVNSRVLFDFGPTLSSLPDANGNYWNNVTTGIEGVKVSNAVATDNTPTGIGLEIISRIDGTFNIAGPGTNTGNTTGDVGDYLANATTDFAFADPSATNGQWKLTGLDPLKEYHIKFWGSRTGISDSRIIEIKRADQSTWQQYDATNNTSFSNAAVFTLVNKTEVTFDIRVKSGSIFGYIGLIDMDFSIYDPGTNIPPIARAGSDKVVTLPGSSVTLDGSLSEDYNGTIASYEWTKLSGPASFNINTPGNATTLVNNLVLGVYTFELKVTDNEGAIGRDTVSVTVNSRILFDFGPTLSTDPDANGNYWNNVTTGTAGIKVANAVSTGNTATGISLEIINRIDGTFNTGGPGTNTGNTAGNVQDYLDNATTDFAFAHPSATNGQWKLAGLDASKQYTVKFWGTRSVSDERIIEIKRNDESTWLSYNAANNTNYNNAAVFTITGKTDMTFDFRVGTNSPFGYVCLIDINVTDAIVPCTPSVSIAASPSNTICDGTSVTFTATPVNGGSSPAYQWLVNGLPVGTNSDTYTTNGLLNNDQVSVQMTSNDPCATPATATSNTITMTVNPNLPVGVSITADPGNTICDGTSVTFTATPTNGGSSPAYQWFNGANPIAGETASTYTSSTLVNGDVISVQLISNETCATGNPATSNSITMTVNSNLPVSVSITADPGNTICDGTSVTFTASPVNGGSNPAYQWFNGANPIAGETSATYTSSTLVNGDVISVQLTSNETCATGNPATSNSITMTVNPNLPVSVTITADPGNTICDGTSVTFTASPVNGGGSPAYQWFNGANPIAGETSSTYTSSTLVNGDVISVQLISNETCATSNPATSNIVTMTVNPNLPVSVSISANPGNTICDGTSVTFTATPTNGGSSPAYQWFNGANPIAGETSSTYTSSTLVNGDVISVQLISNETCATGNPATSNSIAMTVNPNLPVSVSISANPGNTICDGTSVTFTATPTNGGSSPAYQWFNGANPIAGETSATYTSSTLVNGDVISVQLTSNETCATVNPATSNSITMTVNPNLPVSVSITADPGNTICDGTSVTFTASPVNGGGSPAYQWFNGANPIVGETSSTYTSSTLVNGDVISVQLTSNETCATGNPATSNSIAMTVNPNLPVSVTILANPGNTICDGTSVTFTATPTNGGSSPAYQWFNGANPIAGETSATYTSSTLVNGDVISVQLTSNETCATGNPATSNSITMTVNSNLPVSVSISADPGNTICDGTSVTFTASPVNGGSSPAYQWFNGANPIAGETSATYTSSTLVNGDVISVQLTSNETCATGNPATSNSIAMTVNPNLPVSVSITADPGNTICDGTSVTFTASPVNGGSSPAYQWFNGANPIAGETSSTYTSSTLVNGDVISVQLTSNETCATGNPATSNSITMTVNPNLPVSVSISANPGNTICDGTSVTFTASPVNGGSSPAYQWFNGANPIAGETSSTYTSSTLVNGDVISVQLISNETCATGNPATSNSIAMTVNPNLPVSVSISANPGNTICDGTSVTFTASPVNGGSSPAYQWFNGANPIAGETLSTYTSSTLVNGDAISVQLTSNETCATGNPATSNTVTMTVNPNLPVSVSISANPGNTICDGTSVTFTASPVNGGSSPAYQWFNGANPIAGETSSTYTSSTLVNGDVISVQLISNETCATGNPATSNSIAMTVNPNLPVSVSISADPGNTICDGTSVTFTASPVNGGSSPAYQWFNGANPIAGETSSTYTSSTLVNGDVISVQLTSNETCATGNPATSNTVTMTVNPNLPVSVSISANPGSSVCPGTNVTFTANPVNGGSSPVYQWFNGVDPIVGETSSTYTTSTLVNGDVISVQLTSSETCATSNPATSNTINISINPSLPVAVTISANPGSSICPGSTVTFTANPVNGGTNPQYQWKLNGNDIVGETGPTYVASGLSNNDQVSCEMISNAECISTNFALSNTITITILPVAPPLGSIVGPTSICSIIGTANTATYSVPSVINASEYIWTVPPGVSIVSGQTTTAISVLFDNTYPSVDTIKVNAGPCTISQPSVIAVRKVLPALPGPISGPTSICEFVGQNIAVTYTISPVAGVTSYEWTAPNGAQITSGQGSTSVQITFSNAFNFGSVRVVSVSNCGVSNPRDLLVRFVRPGAPGAISGTVNACESISTATPVSYSIDPVAEATSYTWVVPANAQIVDGQGTTSISVLFTQGYVTGNILVRAESNCGSSANSSLTVSGFVPNAPGEITGPANSCLYINSPLIATYSIRKVASASSYIWTVPAGITIIDHPAGLGVNDTIINVSFNGSFVSGSQIAVQSAGCGISLARTITIISSGTPLAPGAMTGPVNSCPLIGYDTTVTYKVPRVFNATSYTWTVSAGINIISHPNGPGINDTIIEVNFNSGFVTGTVSVTANNGCGISVARVLTVRTLFPKTTPTITGPTDVCALIGNGGTTYTIRPVANATSYTWTVPAVGASVTHPNGPGINDTIIIVNFTAEFTTGSITARADAACGNSSTRTLTLTKRIPANPGFITATNVQSCPIRQVSYSIAALPLNATSALWTVPDGAIIVSGQSSTSILVEYPSTVVTGVVRVTGVNNCAQSATPRSLGVNLPACPLQKDQQIQLPYAKPLFSQSETNQGNIRVNVMPNPTVSHFTLSVESIDQRTPVSMKIFDINGRVVETRTGLSAGQSISVGHTYRQGFYIAEFMQGTRRVQMKLIKQ